MKRNASGFCYNYTQPWKRKKHQMIDIKNGQHEHREYKEFEKMCNNVDRIVSTSPWSIR